MGENLVIVESPAKAKTIEKFLGSDYTVKSSFGHIRDLSKKNLGIDIEHGFAPEYLISDDKKKVVSELKSASEKASAVWLASDEDREGEAIAWHLYQTLGLDKKPVHRIVFHEITKPAILSAIKNPREIDMNLVMAQQARRVLDRLVGFELSPVLWKKVAPKLSAGRVQSVALRLIVEREREIMSFKSEPFFKVTGIFNPDGTPGTVKIKTTLDTEFKTEKEASAFLEKCKDSVFKIENIETKDGKRSPAPPFTTSSLQQEASRKLGFSVSRTMSIAQKLYESGLITYMRTDSTNLSALAINAASAYIKQNFGEEYSNPRQYKTKSKGAQEAHEAIRPTYMENAGISGTVQEKRLYELIWKRTMASQMSDAIVQKTDLTIGGSTISQKFNARAEQIKFDGFLKLYIESRDEENEQDDETAMLPPVHENQLMNRICIQADERFTQKPPRYTEASLVKKLEELGIGRPSTYAPTISTLMDRQYIVRDSREGHERQYARLVLEDGRIVKSEMTEITGSEKSKLFPQDIGMLVTDFLTSHFKTIMDYGFTAKIEKEFDMIAAGKAVWNKKLGEFYSSFHSTVEDTLKDSGYSNSERILGNDPKSGKAVKVRLGKYGPFVQIGENGDADKKYASLAKGQLIESITLEEALKLFDLPKTLGEYDGDTLIVAIGRFGPYIRKGKSFISIGKDYDPYTITLQQAIGLVDAYNAKEAKKHILSFEKEGIEVLNGRFGPYIKHNGNNYKIPKSKNASDLTVNDCFEIISASDSKNTKKASTSENSKSPKTSAGSARKAAAKKGETKQKP